MTNESWSLAAGSTEPSAFFAGMSSAKCSTSGSLVRLAWLAAVRRGGGGGWVGRGGGKSETQQRRASGERSRLKTSRSRGGFERFPGCGVRNDAVLFAEAVANRARHGEADAAVGPHARGPAVGPRRAHGAARLEDALLLARAVGLVVVREVGGDDAAADVGALLPRWGLGGWGRSAGERQAAPASSAREKKEGGRELCVSGAKHLDGARVAGAGDPELVVAHVRDGRRRPAVHRDRTQLACVRGAGRGLGRGVAGLRGRARQA